MRKLVQGLIEYHHKRRPQYREVFARLALGQQPDALLVACSDSRVAPNVFASTEPGDVFVLRNVGNIIPHDDEPEGCSEHAVLEYAVQVLNVSDVIICGHSSCGAMRALLGDVPPNLDLPHVSAWLRHGQTALRRYQAGERMKHELPDADHLSQINVLVQLEHALSYPEVKRRVDRGDLRLHGWWFDIGGAEVREFDPALGAFMVIDESRAEAILQRLAPVTR